MKRAHVKTWAGLVKQIAAKTIGFLRGIPNADAEYLKVWMAIKASVEALKVHCSSKALEYAWIGFTHMFDWTQVVVWELRAGDVEPVCGDPIGTGNDVMNVMCFRCGGDHYDLLAPSERCKVLDPEFNLDREGFQIFRACFPVSLSEVDMLREHSMIQIYEELFNNAGKENDKLRRQIFFKTAADFHNRLNAKLGAMFKRHSPKDMVILRSDPGCSPQRVHPDYMEEALSASNARNDCMPLGCVLALMENTLFDVWPGAIHCSEAPPEGRTFKHSQLIQPGDFLVFRGDLVHAGAAFKEFNIRIHAFLDVRGV